MDKHVPALWHKLWEKATTCFKNDSCKVILVTLHDLNSNHTIEIHRKITIASAHQHCRQHKEFRFHLSSLDRHNNKKVSMETPAVRRRETRTLAFPFCLASESPTWSIRNAAPTTLNLELAYFLLFLFLSLLSHSVLCQDWITTNFASNNNSKYTPFSCFHALSRRR